MTTGDRTMAVLTYRAEQALLGAMLQQPRLAGMLGYLEPGDFAWNQHRVLLDALTTAARSGTVNAGEWRAAIEAAALPQLSPEYLDELQAACSDPRHGPAYGAMVMEASTRRTVAELAEDLASEAETLGYDSGRLIRAAGAAGHEIDNDARYLALVATAMRAHSARFNPDTSFGAAGPPERGNQPTPTRPGSPAASTAWQAALESAAPESEQAKVEERVLAALVQRHRETGQVMSTLPGTAFTDPFRREVFYAIRSLFASTRPIDPLTIDWEVTRSQASSSGTVTRGRSTADSDDSYVTRLSRMSIGDAPVTSTADALLAELNRSGNEMGSGKAEQPRALRSVPGPMTRSVPGQAPVRSGSRPADISRLLQPPPRLPRPDIGREQQM
jgi:hypothetical protein